MSFPVIVAVGLVFYCAWLAKNRKKSSDAED
jgi:hypothetical protein